MRILFLTPLFPYPTSSGGLIKTGTILQYLVPRHSVDVLCFHRQALSVSQSAFAAEFPGHILSLPLCRERTPINLLRSYGARLPLSVYRNRSRQMWALVAGWLSERTYDAIFVDHWLMAQYLPAEFPGLALLHQHNAEHVIWQQQACGETNPLLKLLLRREGQRVRRYEAAILPRFRWVFAVSEEDRQSLIALGAPAERVLLLPNLPQAELLDRPPLRFAGSQPHILYLGTLSWQPNREGVERFLRQVFPTLQQVVPEARFLLAGEGAPRRLLNLASSTLNVDSVGPVEEAEPLYRQARVFLEPAYSGGGTKVKVLNALARGLPVVTTPQGAQGIDVLAEEHLLVAQDPPSIVEAVRRLMTDQELWERLSNNGRRLMRERYQPASAFEALDRVLASAN